MRKWRRSLCSHPIEWHFKKSRQTPPTSFKYCLEHVILTFSMTVATRLL
jgi:hypothetical protein